MWYFTKFSFTLFNAKKKRDHRIPKYDRKLRSMWRWGMSVLYVKLIKTFNYAVLGNLSVKDDINDAKTNRQVKAPMNLKVGCNEYLELNIYQLRL